MTYTPEQMINAGGSEWRSRDGSKYRVYFDVRAWAPLIGLDVSYYNTGHISGATLDGEIVSNSRAGRIMQAVGKVFWEAGEITVMPPSYPTTEPDVESWIRDGIRAAVEKLGTE